MLEWSLIIFHCIIKEKIKIMSLFLLQLMILYKFYLLASIFISLLLLCVLHLSIYLELVSVWMLVLHPCITLAWAWYKPQTFSILLLRIHICRYLIDFLIITILFKTDFWVLNHLLNLRSPVLNSQRLYCSLIYIIVKYL